MTELGWLLTGSQKTSPFRNPNNRSELISTNFVGLQIKSRLENDRWENGRKRFKYLNVNSSSLPISYSSGSCSRSYSARQPTFRWLVPRYFARTFIAASQKDTRTSRIYSSLTRPIARIAASPASWISEFVIHPFLSLVPFSSIHRLCLILSWHRFGVNARETREKREISSLFEIIISCRNQRVSKRSLILFDEFFS